MTDTFFRLKPDSGVKTNWSTIGSVVAATAFIVGGIFSIKADIADAAKAAHESRALVEEIRSDLLNLRISLGTFSVRPPSPAPTPKAAP